MSIKEKIREIKDNQPQRFDTLLTALLIVFSGFLGLGFGLYIDNEKNSEPVRIEEIPIFSALEQSGQGSTQSATTLNASLGSAERAVVVGSKNSDKYHYPWCSGAKRISEKNKVSFASIEEARNAGYSPAGNCPGLE